MNLLASKLRLDWIRFGYYLHLPGQELQSIEINFEDNERCTRQVLFKWRELNPTASWEPIAEALKLSGLFLLSAIVTKRYKNPGPTFCQTCQRTHGLEYPACDIHDALTSFPNSMLVMHKFIRMSV